MAARHSPEGTTVAPTLQNNPDKHRYEAADDGKLVGYCEYNLLSGSIMFTHTEVLQGNEGKGIGSFIAKGVLDDARAQGLSVIPTCQFIAGYIRKHRAEYIDLVQPQTQAAFRI
ncbi:MAG: N-acetyltransferase [Comamonadaceae bacterium]|nr:MAG: N-acetyltransferase [Comamonadaceae bacterium]